MCFWCTRSWRGIEGISPGETSRKSILRESAPSKPKKSSPRACCGVRHSARGRDRTMLMLKGPLSVVSCPLLEAWSGIADVLKFWFEETAEQRVDPQESFAIERDGVAGDFGEAFGHERRELRSEFLTDVFAEFI